MHDKKEVNETEAVVKTVHTWLGNPIFRGLLKFVSGKGKYGNRLDNGLKKYAGFDTKMTLKDKIAYKIIRYTINKGTESFDASKEEMKEYLKEPIFRRGIVNILEGIARYGVQTPQTLAAPFLVVWDCTKNVI